MTDEPLKLVILYNATENWYSLSAHNQTPEEAQAFIEKWNPHLKPGFSFLSLDQRKRHRAADPKDCRTCREVVQHSSGLEPKPKFKRRET